MLLTKRFVPAKTRGIEGSSLGSKKFLKKVPPYFCKQKIALGRDSNSHTPASQTLPLGQDIRVNNSIKWH